MAIDIRARVTCTLGEVISASISDSYIQGSGLIQTSGSCQIKGIITPNVGDKVVFRYTKSGITRRVPRTMRVLSSFADPFRRVTDVELGCKLTYLQDLKDPIVLYPFEDPENSELTNKDAEIITFPTYASSVMGRCLSALGVSATSIPLNNRFSVAEFDLSAGYVSVLSDLLVSESYCGYLDENETLNIINLSYYGGTGPVISSQDLIDIGPIGVGQLPGDAVFVSYSTLKLRPPDDEPIAEREEEEGEDEESPEDREFGGTDTASENTTSQIVIAYDLNGEPETVVYSDNQYSYTETLYRVRSFQEPRSGGSSVSISPGASTVVGSGGSTTRRAVVIQRKTYEKRSAASVAGGAITQYLSAGLGFGNSEVTTETLEKFDYDAYGNESFRSLRKTGSRLFGLGMVGLQLVYQEESGPVAVGIPGGNMLLEETYTRTETSGNYKRTFTTRYGPWIAGIAGQQSVAEARDYFTSASGVGQYIDAVLGGRALLDTTASTTRSRGGEQSTPLPEDVINEELAEETGDPSNGFRTESVSEIEVATGSSFAQRRIELSMPYAPDDSFFRTVASVSPTVYNYYSFASDAPAKASRFGRAQNRMLLGNRSGMNIQIVPEKLPSAPFAPVYIEAAGTMNLYRVNAASWTMDSSGIVASTDAMFWGTAGRTT
jgi:hypothetical protein